jgi:hypothetical protein
MTSSAGFRGLIDALDECLTDLLQLLDFIAKNSSRSRGVKWIVSGRRWRGIQEGLKAAGRRLRLSLELNAKSVSNAVSIYIGHKVRQLAKVKKDDSKTKTAFRTYLYLKAN